MRNQYQQVKVTARLSWLGLALLAVIVCVSCGSDNSGNDNFGNSQELHLFYADSSLLTAVSEGQYRLTMTGFSDQQYYVGPESERAMAVGRFFTDEWGVRFASENPIAAIIPIDPQGNITGIYYMQTSSPQYDAQLGLLSLDVEWAGHTNAQPGSGRAFGNLLLILSSDYHGDPKTVGAGSVSETKKLIVSANADKQALIDPMIAVAMAQLESLSKTMQDVSAQMQSNLLKIKELQEKIKAEQNAQEALINANGGSIPIEGAAHQSYELLRTAIDDSNGQISNLSHNNSTLQVQLQNLMGTYQTSVTITSNLFRQYSDGLQDIISNIR
jgi:hypothetical protein